MSVPASTSANEISVSGDVTVDTMFCPAEATPPTGSKLPWHRYQRQSETALPGGAWLVAALLRALAGDSARDVDCPHFEPTLPDTPRTASRLARLRRRRDAPEDDKVYRIDEPLGYTRVPSGKPARVVASKDDDASLRIHVDLGHSPDWPASAGKAPSGTTMVMARCPIDAGALVASIRPEEDPIVVTTAGELRDRLRIDSSAGLSWDRTAYQLAEALERAVPLAPLRKVRRLLVLLGVDGALAVIRPDDPETAARYTFVFDPARQEGDWCAERPGAVLGIASAFTAGVARHIALHQAPICSDELAHLSEAAKHGLGAARAFLDGGYTREDGQVSVPATLTIAKPTWKSVEVPIHDGAVDESSWRILDVTKTQVEVARKIATRGTPALDELRAPRGVFGNMQTIDRQEIEGLSSIRDLIRGYLANPRPARPLCLAVFGPPGSGKSFGVREVARSLGDDRLVERTFNVSQFLGYDDLAGALHLVRDDVLRGRIPFVLIDEFDTALDGTPLGWLKYFLAPMQDGSFQDRGSEHPLGKAVLVFAGGTRSSYGAFAGGDDTFVAAKGPDFVSRLRGHVDVLGPNPQHAHDDHFVLRRAILLQSLLQRDGRTKSMRPGKAFTFDNDVLRALLLVPKYLHGARSMEAVLDMCRIAGATRFGFPLLPADPQLAMHVDAAAFRWLISGAEFQKPDATLKVASRESLFALGLSRCGLEGEPACRWYVNWLIKMTARGDEWKLLPDDQPPTTTPLLVDHQIGAFDEAVQKDYRSGVGEVAAVASGPPGLYRRLPPSPYTLLPLLGAVGLGVGAQRPPAGGVGLDEVQIRGLAEALHTAYIGKHGVAAWDTLPPAYRDSNVDAARHAVPTLARLGYGLAATDPKAPSPTLFALVKDDPRLEALCEVEHGRFVWERVLRGWTWGPRKDLRRRVNPTLVPWTALPDHEREKDAAHWECVFTFLFQNGVQVTAPA